MALPGEEKTLREIAEFIDQPLWIVQKVFNELLERGIIDEDELADEDEDDAWDDDDDDFEDELDDEDDDDEP